MLLIQDIPADQIAQRLHESLERLNPQYYPDSKPTQEWKDVAPQHKEMLIKAVEEVMRSLYVKQVQGTESQITAALESAIR